MTARYDRRYIVNEIRLLRGTDSVDNIAARLGFSSRLTLARRLTSWGYADLAVIFDKKPAKESV